MHTNNHWMTEKLKILFKMRLSFIDQSFKHKSSKNVIPFILQQRKQKYPLKTTRHNPSPPPPHSTPHRL